MSKKISELDEALEFNEEDFLVINQNDETKKVSKENAFLQINEKVNNLIGLEEYDNTTTYDVGDYCIYNNTLYECNTQISTAEEWDSDHWTVTSIREKINKDAITCSLSSSISVAAGGGANPIDNVKEQVGNDFTYDATTKRIICNRDGHVKVSAQVDLSFSGTQGNIRIDLAKNGTSFAATRIRNTATGEQGFNISEQVVEVQQGDYLNLYVNNWSLYSINITGDSRFTFMTAKYI